jgi:hypothetical protein
MKETAGEGISEGGGAGISEETINDGHDPVNIKEKISTETV